MCNNRYICVLIKIYVKGGKLFVGCSIKLKAFTLAEILITIGIIGIISAMTFPVLTNKIKRMDAASKLKKFNSMMLNAVIMSEQANGPVGTWTTATAENDIDTKEFFETYLKPYIKFIKTSYTSNIDSVNNRNTLYVYLNDGSVFYFQKGKCVDFTFDINGEKKPNTLAEDQFVFLLCSDDAKNYWCNGRNWCPYNRSSIGYNKTRKDLLNECINSPLYCSALLEFDNWEFKSDYPY